MRGRANPGVFGQALMMTLMLVLIAAGGVPSTGDAASPSGNSRAVVVPPPPTPPVKAKPVQPPPGIQPRSGPLGSAGQQMSQPPSIGSRSLRSPSASCRSRCATSCYNTTSCSGLNVAECTSARQRCRMSCSSSCY